MVLRKQNDEVQLSMDFEFIYRAECNNVNELMNLIEKLRACFVAGDDWQILWDYDISLEPRSAELYRALKGG